MKTMAARILLQTSVQGLHLSPRRGAEGGSGGRLGQGWGEALGRKSLAVLFICPHYPLKVIKSSSHQRLRAGFTPRPSSHGREIMSVLTGAGKGVGAQPRPCPHPITHTYPGGWSAAQG